MTWTLCRSRDGTSWRDDRRRFKLPFAGAPHGRRRFRCSPAASCPEFCTYCPHRILTTYRARSVGNILDELSHLVSEEPRPYVVFRDPLFTQDRDRVLELCDGIRKPRARSHVRVRDAARSARRRAADDDAPGGAARDELRRGGGVGHHAEEGRPAADPGDASARDRREVPPARHRHGGVLRVRVSRGHVRVDHGDDRLRRRSRVDRGAVQDPHAVSRHAALQADGAAAHGAGLGALRRLHADVQSSESDAGRSCSSCWARRTLGSTCVRRT